MLLCTAAAAQSFGETNAIAMNAINSGSPLCPGPQPIAAALKCSTANQWRSPPTKNINKEKQLFDQPTQWLSALWAVACPYTVASPFLKTLPVVVEFGSSNFTLPPL